MDSQGGLHGVDHFLGNGLAFAPSTVADNADLENAYCYQVPCPRGNFHQKLGDGGNTLHCNNAHIAH